MVRTWGAYVHYLLRALGRLPNVACDVFRGFPDKGIVEREYKLGRPVQWGAFTSATTDFAAAKGFTDRAAGVIFKIAISSGRDINAYSFFPQEGEVLLSPNSRFVVSSLPYEKDGYTVVDLVEQHGAPWIS